ncbi:Uncharacterized protein dnl_45510 [Desulfonema limicola]|uniref:Uncharacterized protein n=1 Tax=Desulfonema limicola TaxID=45656 RepID=A0A975GI57_9BACT|nr:Uncharacterized protein dnl_45510 [Desulfonema limicola]
MTAPADSGRTNNKSQTAKNIFTDFDLMSYLLKSFVFLPSVFFKDFLRQIQDI